MEIRWITMVDIFLSYASADRPIVRRLADALETRGWSVWWDNRSLRGGQHFDRIIEEAIFTAKVVIVVWSKISVESGWVRDEALLALEEEKLIPLRIDEVRLPLRFKNIHTVDLVSWTGETEAEPFERLVEDLNHRLGPSNSSKSSEQPGTRTEPSSQAEPTDGARRFSVGGNQQPAEAVPSADPPRASPNSGSFPARVATEHRAATDGPTFPTGRRRVGKYLAAVMVTGGMLLGVVVLGTEGGDRDNLTTVFELAGSWGPGSKITKISRSGNALIVDMSPYGRPLAHGSVIDAQTITVTFPDDSTITGRLLPPGTIEWSNRTSWTKL